MMTEVGCEFVGVTLTSRLFGLGLSADLSLGGCNVGPCPNDSRWVTIIATVLVSTSVFSLECSRVARSFNVFFDLRSVVVFWYLR